MNNLNALWKFTDLVPNERREKLLSVTSFDEVIELVKAGTVEYFKLEPRRDSSCLSCSRIFYRLHIGEYAYDAFFNSTVGYRAQYCISTENGNRQNRRLIDAITPLLLDAIKGENEHNCPMPKVLASLRGEGSKIWINDNDWPDIDEIHINYQPWITKAQAATKGNIQDQAARTYAAVGILAPLNTHIEVKGAWLTLDDLEWNDPDKTHRAEDIRNYGNT